jgi:hypothetical protein
MVEASIRQQRMVEASINRQTEEQSMKDAEDEAFDDLARRQGDWGGGFPAKRKAAADKLQGADMESEMLTIVYQSGYHDGKQAALAGREWNFCERCGKRTKDMATIHTCTPPQGAA